MLSFRSVVRVSSAVVVSLLALPVFGQIAGPALQPVAQANRVADAADLGPRTHLGGHVPQWATADREIASRPVDTATPWRVSITLRRDPAVQAAFDKLLADQQTPGSPRYHQWLTPQQVGELYGPTLHDIAAVSAWIQSQGLKVVQVAPSRMQVDADGTLGSVGAAFQTSFAFFRVGGSERRAVRSEPAVPAALAAVISVVGGLTEVHTEPMSHMTPLPQADRYPASGAPAVEGTSPQYTANPGSAYYLAAGDFNTIYDIASVVSGGNTGAKIGTTVQNIAIIGRSEVTTADITTYMANFGANGETGYNLTQTQVPAGSGGSAPGITYTGDTDEATLDVERVVGTANGAQANLVVSAPNNGTDGVTIAINYNVNTLKFPVMTISFGACEYNAGSAAVNAIDSTFATAAAEGIATFVSAGDSLAAGCDAAFTAPPTSTQVLSPNYLCSSSHVTCVGGTEFNDASAYTTYWNGTNASGGASAKSYIPEGAWNETGSASPYQIAGTGGGVSSVIAKPTYQTGTGVPADGYRDTPDVAFTAANHDGYIGVYTSSSTSGQGTVVFSGTSAAAPGMAAIAALINTSLGYASGPLNPLIYKLAASNYATAFHDATIATSGVGTCTETPSMCNNSTAGSSTSLSGGVAGYELTTGFDQSTGWGSLDVAKFVSTAAAANLVASSSHSGNFASGAGNVYTLTVANAGAAASSGTVSVTDTLPSGFAATAMSGTGWTCNVATVTCTRMDALAANSSYAAITLTVTVSAAGGATYANSVAVSLGGTVSDTAIDETYVASATLPPTLSIAFSPASVAVGANTTMTFTFTNPNSTASNITLTGVAFSNMLPTNLSYSAITQFACTSGSTANQSTTTAATSISAGSLAPGGGYCLISLTTSGSAAGTYVDTSSTITATNSSAGTAASATLHVGVTPTKVVFTSAAPASLAAGGNAGTVSAALEDGSNNVATGTSGTSVTLTVTGPSGYSQAYSGSTTNGVASWNLSSIPLTAAGTYTYTAASSGLTSAVASEVVNPGPAAAFRVTGLSTATYAEAAETALVTAIDAYGNTATGFTGTATLSSNDASAVFMPSSYAFVGADAGAHSFGVVFDKAGTFSVTAASGAVSGSQGNVLVQDSIWIFGGNSTLSEVSSAGVLVTSAGSTSTATRGAIAYDAAGYIWAAGNGSAALQRFSPTGTSVAVAGTSAAGVNTPVAVAIDGSGNVWTANGNNSVSELTNAGAALSPGTGFATQDGLSRPSAIAIDTAGGVWITSQTGNSVMHIFGAASPAVTPLSTAVTAGTLGTEP